MATQRASAVAWKPLDEHVRIDHRGLNLITLVSKRSRIGALRALKAQTLTVVSASKKHSLEEELRERRAINRCSDETTASIGRQTSRAEARKFQLRAPLTCACEDLPQQLHSAALAQGVVVELAVATHAQHVAQPQHRQVVADRWLALS